MRDTVTSALKEVAPTGSVVVANKVATIFGLGLQDWVFIMAIVIGAIQILMLIPKIIGCGLCFYRHKTCNLRCKTGGKTLEEEND